MATTPTVLMATWTRGVVALVGKSLRTELAGSAVRGVVADERGGALAIVDGHTLQLRDTRGQWRVHVTTDAELACCLPAGDLTYLGTEDARLLVVDAHGRVEPLTAFDDVPGRDRWYAGSAIIDGKRVGPPLGVRSLARTSDGAALLVNVHVGGIPRSTDGGASFQPTIDIDADVHQVHAHPTLPGVVIAAAAAGLCISHDAGATWTIERRGLHATYCSAVAFTPGGLIVAASTDHFATQGAVYRRDLDHDSLERVSGGLPFWLDGICDTACLASSGSAVVIADKGGNLYSSHDAGRSWQLELTGHGSPSSVAILHAP
jgi:hypothetical protein